MLIKYDPFKQINNVFDSLTNGKNHIDSHVRYKETEEMYVYELDVPGVRKEDLDVHLINGIMTVKWKRSTIDGEETGQCNWYVQNGETVVSANATDGVLTIKLSKNRAKSTKVLVE